MSSRLHAPAAADPHQSEFFAEFYTGGPKIGFEMTVKVWNRVSAHFDPGLGLA
jgi:hypothetical protein